MTDLPGRDDEPRAHGREYSEALARGIRILTLFGAENRTMSLADIAARLGLPRATARRALLTLVDLGYAVEEGRHFRLTPRVMELASAYLGASPATTILQPACEMLAALHEQTFSVAVLEGSDAVMVAYARPRRFYADSVGIGLRLPAYCSAVGRVLLAGLPAGDATALLARIEPEPITPRTEIDRGLIGQRIDAVRAQGFALVEEEVELGFRSMAVPVRRLGGRVAFALNIGMSALRSPVEEMRERYLAVLQEQAATLQQQLI
jgi:IclR family pca regulon transcriptional regulator